METAAHSSRAQAPPDRDKCQTVQLRQNLMPPYAVLCEYYILFRGQFTVKPVRMTKDPPSDGG